ncbi:MAG: hypothetical protein KDD06_09005 [Phaeodactylibacter sp.]|nr:hypothetical protein [Phaeodactylibacter sp.]MCB9267682.1 hypothetical protein [Lewinellaceae bacterium]MCB9287435.1 hypothetical protein [Lewinellaceae bacterium]
MKPSDYLWRLIHYMEKAESRYFRLFAGMQNGKKNYEYLYEEVSKVKKLEKYDEALIRERLDKAGKVPARSFAVTKKYLFENLMRSLRLLHEDRDMESRVRKLYDEATLLFSRGLTEKSLEYTLEAKRLAEKYELFSILIDLLGLEIQHAFFSIKPSKSPFARFEALYREKKAAQEKLAQETEANRLRDQAFILYRTRNTQQGKDKERRIKELQNQPFLREPGKFLSFRSELYYHHAWAFIYLVENINKERALYHSGKTLEVWDKYPIFKEEYPRLYKVNLFGYLGNCHSFKDYSNYQITLEKARRLKSRTLTEKASDFQDTAHYELLFLINTNCYNEALKLAGELEEKIKDYFRRKYPLRKDKLVTFYYNTSLLLFVTGHYEDALRYIGEIRKVGKTDIRLDIQYFTRILKLLILFEQGKYDQLDYKEPYVKKILKNNDMYSEFDATVLGHLRKLIKGDIESEERKTYQALLKDIGFSEEKFKKVRGREEIKIWARSKIERRPMAEVLTEMNEAAMAKA